MDAWIVDYYKILGLSTSATLDQIKKAFRQLAIEFHPDKNPNNPTAENKFQRISEAYKRITDPEAFQDEDELDFEDLNNMFASMFADMVSFLFFYYFFDSI